MKKSEAVKLENKKAQAYTTTIRNNGVEWELYVKSDEYLATMIGGMEINPNSLSLEKAKKLLAELNDSEYSIGNLRIRQDNNTTYLEVGCQIWIDRKPTEFVVRELVNLMENTLLATKQRLYGLSD